ncbi:MAG: ThiF family adenylyltransferase [Gemmatimonadaceae bacterium]|nr:ThiF family adenylyltransferase [Gemmatimonadaceae bacterium]
MSNRFDRQERFFGKTGQAKLASCRVAIVGVGGLGSVLVQQLALLGVGHISLIDSEELADTDRNRFVGARYDDPVPGSVKVQLAARLIASIDPSIRVETSHDSLLSHRAFDAVIRSHVAFGCLDSEGARLVLTELCAAYDRPYIDLASDIIPGEPLSYGGRVCVSWDGTGCLVCRGQLDVAEAQVELAGEGERKARDILYGVRRTDLGTSGPSVMSINGVVASLGATEFMVGVTGVRLPRPLLTYRASTGGVSVSVDPPSSDCYYCHGVRGKRDRADVARYLRGDLSAYVR